ncbi:hypothetical protein HanHA89_Chr16g0641181 [Helianthus annuus]|nr:hypothetical protein HanHA89_Chr16g0641181 [Helianthus annuus]
MLKFIVKEDQTILFNLDWRVWGRHRPGVARRRTPTPPPIGASRRLRLPNDVLDGPVFSLLTHTSIHIYVYFRDKG